MTNRSIVSFAVLVFGLAAIGFTEPRAPQPVVEEFLNATREYMTLHQRIEEQQPAVRLTENENEIGDSTSLLASAIRTARISAREGDVFRPPIAEYLRALIGRTLQINEIPPGDLLAANLEEADEFAELPVVNGSFPWGRGAMMWPCLLEVLPPLPEGLMYRFVGRDLVLLDIHADLIVDILRDAVKVEN